MKLATRLVASASLVLAVASPTQAFFLNEDTLEYKMHILECLALVGDPSHSEKCGGPFGDLPFDWVKGGGPPAPAPAPVIVTPYVVPCLNGASLPLAYGERIHVAVNAGPCAPV